MKKERKKPSILPVVVGDVPVLNVGLDVTLPVLGGVHGHLGNVLLDDPAVLEHNLQGRGINSVSFLFAWP